MFETLQYVALSLLFGTVDLSDLHVLGMARGTPTSALYGLIAPGIAGYGANPGFPEQYAYNPSFFLEAMCMALAAINVALFSLQPLC